MKRIIWLLILMFLINNYVLASDNSLALTLAGEAGGEGYIGIYAVACVIQNRAKIGHLSPEQVVVRGFYGKDNKIAAIALATQKNTILKVVFLLKQGKLKDITFGATHFENIEAFGMPKYIKKNPNKWIITCKIGRHTFFKEKNE